MRKPNYNRKYKKRFYLLLGVGVIGTLLVLVNPLINKIVDDREISMVEGVDFSQEVMVIDNKEVVNNLNYQLSMLNISNILITNCLTAIESLLIST